MSEEIKAIAFDLDGTIYLGDRLAEGAIDTVEFFRDKGIKIVYFTNNSASTRQQIYLKLSVMGVNLSINDVYTSGYACAMYVKKLGLKRVFCMGSFGLKEELQNQGIASVSEDNLVDALVIGLDRQFDYSKLAAALNAWKSGIRAIACNIDRSFPVENGYLMPGCGAIVAALEGAAGKKVDDIIGKPNTFMIELATQNLGLDRKSILVVGDNIESDIEMANNFGCPSILISSESPLDSFAERTIKTLPELKVVIQTCK